MIADMVEEVLSKNGYAVCGIARTVAEGVMLGRRHRPDLAIIDMRLADGGFGTEVAAQLRPLGKLGVLFASGNIELVMRSAADGDACIAKPYRFPDLLRALEIVAELVATGAAFPPFPRGFHMLPPVTAAPVEALHG
jgi:DNA-binding response OmpR family regulator